jgi:hypothetical protein
MQNLLCLSFQGSLHQLIFVSLGWVSYRQNVVAPMSLLKLIKSRAQFDFSGLYYNHIITTVSDNHKWCLYFKNVTALALALARVINFTPRVRLQIVALLTYNYRSVIYNCNMFIEQTTAQCYIANRNKCYKDNPLIFLLSFLFIVSFETFILKILKFPGLGIEPRIF